MLPLNPYWAGLMHPAANTDTHSVPRPGTIPQALIHPCLLIPLPANPPASAGVTRSWARSPWVSGVGVEALPLCERIWGWWTLLFALRIKADNIELSSLAWCDRKAFVAYFWPQSRKEHRGRGMEKGTEKGQETNVDRRIELLSLKN